MKIVAQLMAFGNLLALLAWVGLLLALYPLDLIEPLAGGLIGALGLAVLFGQRAYALFLTRQGPEPQSPPLSPPAFAPLPGWMAGQGGPGLLAAGNLLFAGALVLLPYLGGLSYSRFLVPIDGRHPLSAWFPIAMWP